MKNTCAFINHFKPELPESLVTKMEFPCIITLFFNANFLLMFKGLYIKKSGKHVKKFQQGLKWVCLDPDNSLSALYVRSFGRH